MATIIKTPAKTFRAIIRTPNKTITKTFKLKKLATAWAKRIEGDADLMAATGMKGASIPFSKLADEFHDQWTSKDNITSKIRYWKEPLGDTPLIKIDDIQIDALLKEYTDGDVQCGRNRKTIGAPTRTGYRQSYACHDLQHLRVRHQTEEVPQNKSGHDCNLIQRTQRPGTLSVRR